MLSVHCKTDVSTGHQNVPIWTPLVIIVSVLGHFGVLGTLQCGDLCMYIINFIKVHRKLVLPYECHCQLVTQDNNNYVPEHVTQKEWRFTV